MTGAAPTADRLGDRLERASLPRLFALAGTVGLLASFLFVLYDVLGTVGDPLLFYPVVMATLLAATILSRVLHVTAALVVAGLLFAVGMGWHVLTLDGGFDVWLLLSNNVELLTGETVLRIQQADVWALTVAPTPVFVTWYFALRRRYVGAALAGGGMLAYLVLTGDAGTSLTLLGVVAAGVMISFGEIEARGWSSAADQAVVVLAVMVLVPLVVTIVPGGAASPVAFVGDDAPESMEANVITGETTLDIVGEVNQSPEPRFTVTSDEARLWRTGSYDRYTGDGWVRTSDPEPLAEEGLDGPPGPTRNLTQEIEANAALEVFPAAWQPVAVEESIAPDTLVGDGGGLELDRTLSASETVELRSAVPDPENEDLADAGRNYPESVRERYTQLPESTPGRVGERTEQIARNADSPFETAVAVEQWLETNREYSLGVERPEGDIADAFLFDMDAGYCTYYATTMVTMLRSQEIPARMAVGYSPGQPVGDDEYLVRGLNSHAWVEVYFPEIGWVEFDPTPGGPRQEIEQAAIDERTGTGSADGGSGDGSGGDGGRGSGDVGSVSSGIEDPVDQNASTNDIGGEQSDVQLEPEENLQPGDGPSGADGSDSGSDHSFGVLIPSREQLVVSLVALAGMAAWTRHAGVSKTVSRRASVRFQRRADPETDVERAYERLLLVLEERHRPRRTGETVRQYLADIHANQSSHRVLELYERARYAGDVTRADADEAVDLVDRIRKRG